MTLYVENLSKLIAHLEAQPPERINMGWAKVGKHPCGTCGCILGHAELAFGLVIWRDDFENFIGLDTDQYKALTHPPGWRDERNGVRRYPAHRVIATLKRLLAHYLATGEVKVDWGPEPGDEPAQLWSAPQAVEVIKTALPTELTRLLGEARPAAADAEG